MLGLRRDKPRGGGVSYRVLSSAQTFQVKYVGPLVFVVATLFLVAMLDLGLFPGLYRQTFGARLAPSLEDVFWAVWIVCGLITFWWAWQLKRIAVDGESIYISDYLREAKLPLAAVLEVRENRWLRMHPVTIELGRETPWGSTVRFMPKIRYIVPGWVSHPVVAELRDMAYWAKAGQRMEQQLRVGGER